MKVRKIEVGDLISTKIGGNWLALGTVKRVRLGELDGKTLIELEQCVIEEVSEVRSEGA